MAKKLSGISDGQIADNGDAMLINLDFEDGSFEQIKLGLEAIPKLTQTLAIYKELCERSKIMRAADPFDLASPWEVTDVQSGRAVLDQSIAIRFSTTTGIPLILKMSRALAEKTIRSLQDRMSHDREGPKPN